MKNSSIVVLSIALVILFFVYQNAVRSEEELRNVLVETNYKLLQTEDSLKKTAVELRQLEDQVKQMKLELSRNRSELSSVNSQLSLAESEISSLNVNAEQNKYYFYYVKPEQSFSFARLAYIVERSDWLQEYEQGRFDCSEMSAALEWRLENEGFHTLIVTGETPDGSGDRHAWLLVETSPGKYTPVEATSRRIIYSRYPYFHNYFEYERKFETIQEAIDYGPAEFDWWESL